MSSASAGILQKIELLGESYTVQTEVINPAARQIRTSIFHGGTLAATRESSLPAEGDTDQLLSQRHQGVVEGFIKNAVGYESWATSGQVAIHPAQVARAAAPDESDELELGIPPLPEDPFLCDGLDVRRLYGQLRLRIATAEPEGDDSDVELPEWFTDLIKGGGESDSDSTGARLREARAALEWAMSEPIFARARVAEQVQIHHLAERIDQWLSDGAGSAEAAAVWKHVHKFLGFVHEINRRADLIDFDRRLLAWGLATIQRRGASAGTIKALRWLFGRDPELDAMLEMDFPPRAEEWVAHLERVRTGLD